MKTAEASDIEKHHLQEEILVDFPAGLLGFEGVKAYALRSQPGQEPFLWLEMLTEPNQAFLVLPPEIACPDYRPELSDEDVEFLQLQSPEDALMLNIVTLHEGKAPTVNLKGPLVVNRHTRTGKQVIPVNAADYEIQHLLPVE